MNREGAETYLRLLGEAQMRESPGSPRPWAAGQGARARMRAAGQALTAVGAVDAETAAAILAEFDLAASVREPHGPAGSATASGWNPPVAAVARWAVRTRAGRPRSLPRPSGPPPGTMVTGSAGSAGSAEPEPREPEPSGHGGTDLIVPAGLTVPFRHGDISGEMHLLAFARTGSGAWFLALWHMDTLFLHRQLGLAHPEMLPTRLLTATDDRGAGYELDLAPGSGPEWISEIALRPTPPEGIRWLDVAVPPGPAVRVELAAGEPPACAREVRQTPLSLGEQLLVMIAERLLVEVPPLLQNLRRGLPSPAPRAVQAMAAGLGDIVAALEAADLLAADSPVPARLAALCASLGIDSHGIIAPPAPSLPEPWLSVLAHFQRRKPEPTPVRDGYAAVAAVLPELDGIRLAVCGLHNHQESTVLHVLARGVTADSQPGPLGVDMDFPLSVWLRDSGGRWHVGNLAGRHRAGPEYAIGLQMVPPMPLTPPWVEVLAAGRSAEVRARLPLSGWHPW